MLLVNNYITVSATRLNRGALAILGKNIFSGSNILGI